MLYYAAYYAFICNPRWKSVCLFLWIPREECFVHNDMFAHLLVIIEKTSSIYIRTISAPWCCPQVLPSLWISNHCSIMALSSIGFHQKHLPPRRPASWSRLFNVDMIFVLGIIQKRFIFGRFYNTKHCYLETWARSRVYMLNRHIQIKCV